MRPTILRVVLFFIICLQGQTTRIQTKIRVVKVLLFFLLVRELVETRCGDDDNDGDDDDCDDDVCACVIIYTNMHPSLFAAVHL